MLETLFIAILSLHLASTGDMWSSGALAGLAFSVGVCALHDWLSLSGKHHPRRSRDD